VACGYYIFVQDAIQEADRRFRPSGPEVDARRAAGAGYLRGAEFLYSSFADTSFSGNYANDSFRVNVDVIGNKAVVSSLGLAQTDSSYVDHIIRVEFGLSHKAPHELPSFMRFAAFAGDGLVVSDSLLVHSSGSDIDPDAMVRSIGKTIGNRDLIRVNGSVSRIGSIPKPGTDMDTAAMLAAPSGVASLYGPNVRLVPHNHDVGNTLLAGKIGDGAPFHSPFIWHIEGDLIITGDIRVKGYLLVLVDGNVTIRGNISRDQPLEETTESAVAIYAGGSIAIPSSVSIAAQLYAGGSVRFESGGVHIEGSVSAREQLLLDGRATIQYRPASRALVVNWIRPNEEITMISYDEQ
jgi:hypothetical protein